MPSIDNPGLTRGTLRGTWATVLLPIVDDDAIDWSALDAQLDALLASGVDGIYTNGTAGEFFAQSEDEFDTLTGIVRARCASAGMPCQIGASHTSAQTCRERIRRAAGLRPNAIQVILPDWMPLAPEEVRRTVEGYADAADGIPLVLYNPPHAKTRLSLDDLGALAEEFPALIGIKVAGGDDDWYRQARAALGDLAVFVPGHTLASGMGNGMHGAYSNVACLSPAGAVWWAALMRADPAAAIATETRIQAFLAEHVMPWQQRGVSNAGLDKALARAGRWTPTRTRLRWPYQSVPEAAADRLGDLAREMIPELFRPQVVNK
jgi:dihydrodipicolinate synthase/N-acetylneuraminate lyase